MTAKHSVDSELNDKTSARGGWGSRKGKVRESLSFPLNISDLCISSPRYRQQARALSNIHKDQPGHPVTRAVYWINYILRHNGANHLRSAVYDVSPYQYFLLDVVFTIGAALALSIFALQRLVRLLRGKVDDQGRRDGITRDDGNMANGHCHSESMANGKHKRNGSLKNEKKIN